MSFKIQRIMIDGGFTCPNRDGSAGRGGCTYCRNDSFSPQYCRDADSIAQQISEGKKFFRDKYPDMKYMAYFQSYSATYAPISILRQRYESALNQTDIVGLIIATRPDCLGEDVLDLLQDLSHRTHIEVEIGVETTHDRTLTRINRGHTWQQASDAILRTASRDLKVCTHLILGLPGESQADIIESARTISPLPISSVKLHQLQILRGTRMALEYAQHPEDFLLFPTAQDYVAMLGKFLKALRPDIKVERIVSSAPQDILIAPRWGLKPSEIRRMLEDEFRSGEGRCES